VFIVDTIIQKVEWFSLEELFEAGRVHGWEQELFLIVCSF